MTSVPAVSQTGDQKPTGFDEDTRCLPDGDGLVAELPERWLTPWGAVNGGLAAGVAVRSVVESSDLPLPASASVQFVRAVRPGPAHLTHERFWTGSRTEATRVRMSQDDRTVLEVTVWMVGEGEGLEHHWTEPPDGPGPDSLRPVQELLADEGLPTIPLWENLDTRPTSWEPVLEPRVRAPVQEAWMRLTAPTALEDVGLTVAAILVVTDVMVAVPIWYPHGVSPAESLYFPMTLDLTAQFFHLSRPDSWMHVEASAPVATRGLVGGRASIWSSDSRLLSFGTSQLVCRQQPPEL